MQTLRENVYTYLTERPAHLLVISFAAVICLGTLLLALPVAATAQRLSVLDALFTATSATCVTGLIVVDTGSYFSSYGQAVILSLLQVGGLGIMTISTFIALLLGSNIGLRGEFAISEMIGEQRSRTAFRLLKFIVVSTLLIEFGGALLLAGFFHRAGFSWWPAVWQGVFHSVSAFCNAGFALFPDSLSGFMHVPGIPLVVAGLIVLGGLGFSVMLAIFALVFERKKLTFHAGLVLGITVVLIFGGTVILWGLEYGVHVPPEGLATSLLHAFFQSVTARTAGFNTLDLNHLSAGSRLLMMLLMFIGAAPGSTGGGVKVTTLIVLAAVIRSVLMGHENVVFRGRMIGGETVLRAMALICLALGILAFFCLLLLATQEAAPGTLLFEAVSAFGTVGLSLGVTPQLSPVGKLCIIVLMFIGRVGPLTLLVMARPRKRSVVGYPYANVMIG